MEVLQNLIDNASKYMGSQQNPVIEVGTRGYDEAGASIFFVRDKLEPAILTFIRCFWLNLWINRFR